MRMSSEIFESDVFRQMAEKELVLVNADFPRKKKNQLPLAQQKLNDDMAEKYNLQGKFPYTLLLRSQVGSPKRSVHERFENSRAQVCALFPDHQPQCQYDFPESCF